MVPKNSNLTDVALVVLKYASSDVENIWLVYAIGVRPSILYDVGLKSDGSVSVNVTHVATPAVLDIVI